MKLTFTGVSVLVQTKASAAETLEGAGGVLAHVITATVSRQTFIHIYTTHTQSSHFTKTLLLSQVN